MKEETVRNWLAPKSECKARRRGCCRFVWTHRHQPAKALVRLRAALGRRLQMWPQCWNPLLAHPGRRTPCRVDRRAGVTGGGSKERAKIWSSAWMGSQSTGLILVPVRGHKQGLALQQRRGPWKHGPILSGVRLCPAQFSCAHRYAPSLLLLHTRFDISLCCDQSMVSVCSYVLVPLAASGCARSAPGDCVCVCALAPAQNRIREAREQEEKDRVERERAAAEERERKEKEKERERERLKRERERMRARQEAQALQEERDQQQARKQEEERERERQQEAETAKQAAEEQRRKEREGLRREQAQGPRATHEERTIEEERFGDLRGTKEGHGRQESEVDALAEAEEPESEDDAPLIVGEQLPGARGAEDVEDGRVGASGRSRLNASSSSGGQGTTASTERDDGIGGREDGNARADEADKADEADEDEDDLSLAERAARLQRCGWCAARYLRVHTLVRSAPACVYCTKDNSQNVLEPQAAEQGSRRGFYTQSI